MKFDKQTVQSFVTVAALLLALVAGVFGVKLPEVPEVPDYPDLSGVISVQQIGVGGEGLRAGVRERISIDAREDVYLYNSADLYMYSDDHSTEEFHVDGATGDVTVAGDMAVAGSMDLTGVCELTGGITLTQAVVADSATITGTVSAADLTASDDLSVTDDATITGTLSALVGISLENEETIGNAVNGTIAMTGAVDVSGALQYGANNLYPLGYASDGYQLVLGSSTVTTTTVIVHGLTTPLYGFCTMSGSLTDNEEQKCSVGISGSDVTIYVWKEDGTAGDSGVLVFWQVFGTP